MSAPGGSEPTGREPEHDEQSLDDSTVVVSRPEPDEATVLSPRRADAETELDVDATLPARYAPAGDPGPGPRRTGGGDQDEADPEDGSTMVVRRESRRRAAAREHARSAPETVDPSAHGSGAPRGASPATAPVARPEDAPARAARTPEPTQAIYKPRPAEPARAERAARPERAPQALVDTAAVEASLRARRRRRLAFAVVAATLVAIGAVALVAFLVVGG